MHRLPPAFPTARTSSLSSRTVAGIPVPTLTTQQKAARGNNALRRHGMAPLSVMAMRLLFTLVEPSDARDHSSHLLIHEWRLAADAVPTKQELHHNHRV